MIKKSYYFSMALLGIFIALALFGYVSFVKIVWKKAALISSYNNDIAFGDQKRTYAESMLRAFEANQKDIDDLQNFFIKNQGEVEFIESIENFAKEKGLLVAIDAVSVESPKDIASHGMEYLVLRLHVEGSWAGVWIFSQTLEALPYSIDINSLALLRKEVGPQEAALWKGLYNIRVLKKK